MKTKTLRIKLQVDVTVPADADTFRTMDGLRDYLHHVAADAVAGYGKALETTTVHGVEVFGQPEPAPTD